MNLEQSNSRLQPSDSRGLAEKAREEKYSVFVRRSFTASIQLKREIVNGARNSNINGSRSSSFSTGN